MRTRLKVLAWSILLAGCNDPPSGLGDPAEFRSSPSRQWSGGILEITSPYFSGSDSIPAVMVGSDTARALRISDSTVMLTLPSLPSGTYPLSVVTSTGTLDAGRVEIVGFARALEVAPVYGVPYKAFQVYGRPLVLGGDADLTLRSLDPSSGRITDYHGYSLPSEYGPSPSFRGRDVVVLRDSNRVAGEYRMSASGPQLLDTVGSGFPQQFTRHLVPLRDDAYLLTGSHQTSLYRAGQSAWFTTESVWGVFFSPNSRQMVLGSSVGLPGAQVFSPALADTVFTLPLQSVYGVAWPLDGARIFVSGGHQWDVHNHLMVLDAVSGRVLAEDSVPAGAAEYWSIDVSRDGSHLFVLTQEDSTTSIGVFDGTSLSRLGTLSIPPSEKEHCSCYDWNGLLVLDEANRKIYLVMPTGYQTSVYTFDLLIN